MITTPLQVGSVLPHSLILLLQPLLIDGLSAIPLVINDPAPVIFARFSSNDVFGVDYHIVAFLRCNDSDLTVSRKNRSNTLTTIKGLVHVFLPLFLRTTQNAPRLTLSWCGTVSIIRWDLFMFLGGTYFLGYSLCGDRPRNLFVWCYVLFLCMNYYFY